MAFTKLIARHDRVFINGQDMSNAFREFNITSTDTNEDASGFSVSGVDETLPGARAQGFNGEFFVTEESLELLWPIHDGRDLVEIQWQPNGLVDTTAGVFYGNCFITEINVTNTRGSVSTSPFTAVVGDENGITYVATGT